MDASVFAEKSLDEICKYLLDEEYLNEEYLDTPNNDKRLDYMCTGYVHYLLHLYRDEKPVLKPLLDNYKVILTSLPPKVLKGVEKSLTKKCSCSECTGLKAKTPKIKSLLELDFTKEDHVWHVYHRSGIDLFGEC